MCTYTSNIFFFFQFIHFFVAWYSKGYFEGILQSMKFVVHTEALKNCGMEKYDFSHALQLKKLRMKFDIEFLIV